MSNSGHLGTCRSALLHAGYNVSLSHAAKNSYKTNAPAKVIWVKKLIK